MASARHAYPLVGRPGEGQYEALVRRRAGPRQETEDQGARVGLFLPAENSPEPASAIGRQYLLRQFHSRRHAGRRFEEVAWARSVTSTLIHIRSIDKGRGST